MKFTREKRVTALIPTASMADIAFLLIIFFMVTTVHDVDRTSVNLPTSRTRTEAERGAAVVVMTKTDSGEILYKFSDGEAITTAVGGPEDIYLEASRLTYDAPDQQFVIKADGSIHFEKVDELLDQMRRGGVQNVLLLTEQLTETGP